MRKITRISCRFYAGEFDDQGNMTNELPIASGQEEFNAIIYYPFTLPLTELITNIEDSINGRSERDRAPGQEQGLQTGGDMARTYNPVSYDPSVCDGCGEEFTPARSDQRFCTYRCQPGRSVEAQYKRISGNWSLYLNRLCNATRGREELTPDILMSVLERQQGRCALSGEQLTCTLERGSVCPTNASIDRILAGGPYSEDNIQLVCRAVNSFRRDVDQEEFVEWCRKVASYAQETSGNWTSRNPQGLYAGVCGWRGEAGGETSPLGARSCEACGDQSCWAQDTEANGSGPHQAIGEGRDERQEQPASCAPEGEPLEGGPLTPGVIVNRMTLQQVWEAEALLFLSLADGGGKADMMSVRSYLSSDKFATGEYACFIAYVQGVPRGIVVVERHGDGAYPYYDVHNLYVAREGRGGRAALALLREALSLGKDDEAVYLTTAGPPHPLYTRLGFRPTHSLCVSTVGQIRERLK